MNNSRQVQVTEEVKNLAEIIGHKLKDLGK